MKPEVFLGTGVSVLQPLYWLSIMLLNNSINDMLATEVLAAAIDSSEVSTGKLQFSASFPRVITVMVTRSLILLD